jgi:hypothetical protein
MVYARSSPLQIRRSDFSLGASKVNAVVGDDVKLTIDVEIDKQYPSHEKMARCLVYCGRLHNLPKKGVDARY